MAHGRDKHRPRDNRTRVRQILMRDWDAIGVAGVEEAADEYDSYTAEAYLMLMDERAGVDAIAAYLLEVATEHMGLSSRVEELAETSRRVAETLVRLRPEFETH